LAPDTVPGTLEKLRVMLADLDGYIDRRAAELAKPLLDKALADVAETKRQARAEVQRQEYLVAELRRRLDARDRQLAAAMAANPATPERTPIGTDIDLLCDAVTWAVERRRPDQPVRVMDVQRYVHVGFATAHQLVRLMDAYSITGGDPRLVLTTKEQLPGVLANLRDLAGKEGTDGNC
jgi:hypothetical protein